MRDRRQIELLSPAKNADCAIAAILSGADAVYMGAKYFGARISAGNSYDDIERVCDFAHSYGARVCIALNTIFTDRELIEAEAVANEVYKRGADALIIQDMGLLMCELPPIELHASTQCHITSTEKARFLEAAGFDTLVLARELSPAEILKITQATTTRIESFVHGALCVSYSGQCYLSHAIGGRSGNRGECAQPCRLPYELKDANGKNLGPKAHYLSLKDMNRSLSVGDMLDAGVSAFKIEGRLKDVDYVKNITAFYRQILDVEIAKRKLQRASYGESSHSFKPQPQKSFNRGFTEYFFKGDSESNASFQSPKSRGEFIGIAVKSLQNGFVMQGPALNGGDGIFIENPDGESFGTNVQKSENGKIICGRDCPKIFEGARIWRNKDIKFDSEISGLSQRKMPVDIAFHETAGSYILEYTHKESGSVGQSKISKKTTEPAQNFERASSLISENISKLGGGKFGLNSLSFEAATAPFLKAAQINAMRREALEALEMEIVLKHEKSRSVSARHTGPCSLSDMVSMPVDFRANVLNEKAKQFYKSRGAEIIQKALEGGGSCDAAELMRTRHCILRELKMCKTKGRFPKEFKEPLSLETESAKLELKFNCASCEMAVFRKK